MTAIKRIRDAQDFAEQFNVSRETLGKLELYVELLIKWQKAVNLVAHSTMDEIWHRHMGDSAQILDILGQSDSSDFQGNWLDIGCGGGFPGLVVAILWADKKQFRFHLVESNARKCAFLSDVVRHLDLPVDIYHARIEDLETIPSLSDVTIISARALAKLDQLLSWSEPFFGPHSRAIYLKGRDVQSELEEARKRWEFGFQKISSRTSSDGVILEITELYKK